MAYALTVHCSVAALPPRSRWIDGSAVITTRVSRATMKYAIEVSTTVSTGLTWRVPGVPAPGGATPGAAPGNAPGAAIRSRSVIVLSVREKAHRTVQTPAGARTGRPHRLDWAGRGWAGRQAGLRG